MKNKTNNSGFTLIEALTLLFIFSLITITFYQVITVGTRYILFSKNRLGAIALANEKMEIVRNISYDYVGVQGGACDGIIPQDEDVSENGKNYHVHTLATYVDDSYDGTLGGSPNDTAYKDYKIVKITVSWNNGATDMGSVDLISRFVPPGLEVATSGDGILSINIFSDQDGGAGVPQTTVQVTNSELGFSETRQTDDSGNIMIVGAQESIQKYKIILSKSGYEDVATFAPYPDTAYNPVDTHASVVAGSLNVTNIALNKTADLKIITQDYFGNTIPDIGFDLSGGRRLGAEVTYPYADIFNLVETDQTDSSGEKQYDSISPGQYEFSLDSSITEYEFIGTDPAPPFVLSSEEDLDFKVVLAEKDVTSLLTRISINGSDDPLIDATVELSNALGYSESITTDANSSAFFPKTESAPLVAGTYTLDVSADGFDDYTKEITISENNLEIENVVMEYE
jgi:hypothetical protein